MNKTRHHAREVALQILYRHDLELTQSAPVLAGGGKSPTELIADLTAHFDHFQVAPELREFTAELVAGVLKEMKELDSHIEKNAANWKIPRMPVVDRAILRMATYEMIHHPETSASIVIDEAIELSKQFGNEDTPAFVNGILDAISRKKAEI